MNNHSENLKPELAATKSNRPERMNLNGAAFGLCG